MKKGRDEQGIGDWRFVIGDWKDRRAADLKPGGPRYHLETECRLETGATKAKAGDGCASRRTGAISNLKFQIADPGTETITQSSKPRRKSRTAGRKGLRYPLQRKSRTAGREGLRYKSKPGRARG